MQWDKDFINKVICGDCLEVMKEIPGRVVDLIIADPPYNVGVDYGSGQAVDVLEVGEYIGFIESFLQECKRIGRSVIVTPGNGNQYWYPKPKWTLAWIKKNGVTRTPLTVGQKMMLCTWEPILYYGESPPEPLFHDTIEHSISVQSDVGNHPCPKPLGLFKKLICMGSKQDDLVLDPFLGSGTTTVAAKQLGRKYIGIEINPKYCAIAEDRLRQCEMRLE